MIAPTLHKIQQYCSQRDVLGEVLGVLAEAKGVEAEVTAHPKTQRLQHQLLDTLRLDFHAAPSGPDLSRVQSILETHHCRAYGLR
eukprot:4031007-Pyramimonas_sp.AAC.1